MQKKKISQDECIENCKKVHGDSYNYDNTVFTNTRTKLKILCPLHGEFEVLYYNHLKGHKCKKCQTYGRLTTEECIGDFKKVHGDIYNYDKVIYKNDYTKVVVTCLKHGDFLVSPNHHKRGKGCPKCANKYITLEECIETFTDKHGNTYDYSLVKYKNCNTNVKIICKKCNTIFEVTPADHKNGNGCPICKNSKGEVIIRNWLIRHNINFISQKRFPNCRNKKPLPFDFYLPEQKVCIEFDGRQHFEIVKRSKDTQKNLTVFNLTQLHDSIKNEYCKTNNIKLLRISYKEINNIEQILKENLN